MDTSSIFACITHSMPVTSQRTLAETRVLLGEKKGRVGSGIGLSVEHSSRKKGLLEFEVAFLHVALVVEGGGQWNNNRLRLTPVALRLVETTENV